MKNHTWAIAVIASLLIGVSGGYSFGLKNSESQFSVAVAEQSLVDINRLTVLLVLVGDPAPISVRNEINLNLHRHIQQVQRNEGNFSEDSDKFKVAVMTRLAKNWQKHPPFLDITTAATSSGNPEMIKSFTKAREYVNSFIK
jgi:hypothetical protein